MESQDEVDTKMQGLDDELDARRFGCGPVQGGGSVASMPVARDSPRYNMNHPKRGKAIIINNKNFYQSGLGARNGTDRDRDNLERSLKKLGFEVFIYNDVSTKHLLQLLDDLSREDHSLRDCILIAVLSHGEQNKIYTKDSEIKPDRLWEFFGANNCPTLAGKPKIFLIQACQGDQLDSGTKLEGHTQVDSNIIPQNTTSYTIPNRADFLIVYSTVPGYYAWRNTGLGSWFIQAVSKALDNYGKQKDLFSILTMAARDVALAFESSTPHNPSMDGKKQVPMITSTLIRDIYF